ncbi:MAG: hypothetical protein ABWX84_07690 [Nocardioides sp.]
MTAWPPPPPQQQQQKPRPSRWWFAVGGGLMLFAAAVGVAAWVLLFRGLMQTDTSVPVDGRSHQVTVPTDGDRMVWADTLAERPQCTVTDRESGQEIPLKATNGTFERNEQTAVRSFAPGSGTLDVTCEGDPSTEVEIGPAPDITAFVGGVLVGVLVPLLLGGTGFVIVLVTGVLWTTRPPRPRPV